MKVTISHSLQKVLEYARDEALRTGCSVIGVDHLMLALLREKSSGTAKSLEECGIDTARMKDTLDSAVYRQDAIPYCDIEKIEVSKAAGYAMGIAAAEALRGGKSEVGPEHLLVAIAKGGRGRSAVILEPHLAAISALLSRTEEKVVCTPKVNFTQIIRLRHGSEYPS